MLRCLAIIALSCWISLGVILGSCNHTPDRSKSKSPSSPAPSLSHDEKPSKPITPSKPETAISTEAVPAPLLFANSDKTLHTLIAELQQASASTTRFRPMGGSSVTFRVEFTSHIQAAFKPATKDRLTAYQREIAAFRLAQTFGLTTVPPAILVKYTRDELQTKLYSGSTETWTKLNERIVWDNDGSTMGALIYWVEDAKPPKFSDLGNPAWEQWLLQGSVAPSTSIAHDLSDMLVFDYLIGNWDRFSGGNFKITKDNHRLILLDHNSGFGAPLRGKVHERVYQKLRQVQKFSRTLYAGLLNLEITQLSSVLNGDTPHPILLSDAQIQGVLDRRATILSYIQSLIEIYGDTNVLTFE